jgi:hypothetical protein
MVGLLCFLTFPCISASVIVMSCKNEVVLTKKKKKKGKTNPKYVETHVIVISLVHLYCTIAYCG